jgi:hypothetical protein
MALKTIAVVFVFVALFVTDTLSILAALSPARHQLVASTMTRNLQLFVPCQMFGSAEVHSNQTISPRGITRRILDKMRRKIAYKYTKGEDLDDDLYRDLELQLFVLGLSP